MVAAEGGGKQCRVGLGGGTRLCTTSSLGVLRATTTVVFSGFLFLFVVALACHIFGGGVGSLPALRPSLPGTTH